MTPHKDSKLTIDNDENFIEKDDLMIMKCTSCGHECNMPSWLYGEFANEFKGDPNPPGWQCPKCYKDTLHKKS